MKLGAAVPRFLVLGALLSGPLAADAQPITAAGQPAQLDIRAAGERSIRVTLKPISLKEDFPVNPAVAPRPYPAPAVSLREITRPVRRTIGTLTVDVRPSPLTLTVTNHAGLPVQRLVFETDGNVSFKLDEHPGLGLGEGGPRLPLMRAMWLHYPDDKAARGLGNQFMWGRDLLVAPVFTKGAASRDVYLPGGDWYDWWTNAKSTGGRTVMRQVDLATMPIYVRAGAIVPVDAVRQYTTQPRTDPTTLRIYGGADGQYTLYDDDGTSQEYLKGTGTWTRVTWNNRARRLTIEPGAPRGATNVTASRVFKLLLLPEGTVREVSYMGGRVQASF